MGRPDMEWIELLGEPGMAVTAYEAIDGNLVLAFRGNPDLPKRLTKENAIRLAAILIGQAKSS